MSYIEREALKENIKSFAGKFTDDGFFVDINAVLNAIDFAPAADVVPVVRCGDCKRWKADGGYGLDLDGTKRLYGVCAITNMAIKENSFCNFGAKRGESK